MSKLCRLRRSEGYEVRDDEEQPAKALSSIKIRKELNRAEKNEYRNLSPPQWAVRKYAVPRLRSGQNRLVDLVVPHNRKDNSRHFLGHVANDIHIA